MIPQGTDFTHLGSSMGARPPNTGESNDSASRRDVGNLEKIIRTANLSISSLPSAVNMANWLETLAHELKNALDPMGQFGSKIIEWVLQVKEKGATYGALGNSAFPATVTD